MSGTCSKNHSLLKMGKPRESNDTPCFLARSTNSSTKRMKSVNVFNIIFFLWLSENAAGKPSAVEVRSYFGTRFLL